MATRQPAHRIKGYTEFQRACKLGSKESRTEVRAAFRESGDVLRDDWSHRLASYDARSAANLRTRVTNRGVSVQQRLGKTTGKRPDFGRLQMRLADESLVAKEREIERSIEKAIDRIADHFEGGH